MNIEDLKNTLPETAKDIQLNLSTVLSQEGAPDLTIKQIAGIALAVSYTTRNKTLIQAILDASKPYLNEAEIQAAQSSAAIMGMNNIYYRFIHLVGDSTFSSIPAKLRMNVMSNPGIDKVSFELNSLAVSAINGCGMCMEAHTKTLLKHDVSPLAIQSSIRIAAVLNAVSVSLEMV
ncbi:MAG: carboxymuconolactone decarboxylase family protein [Gammaproteobacteria bacterium]|nr:carboxymuconolactone decarboxylase family protein [Gammaproteobacteria bacterium]MCD8543008.1 carboxymuconolactone decarboxylase family protein [Gammaproteobacteria bacterium]